MALVAACAKNEPGTTDDTTPTGTVATGTPVGSTTSSSSTGDCTPQTSYTDADGDGHGDPASATETCTPPSGSVADGTDCDDADPDNWASCATCVDADGDGTWVGCDAFTTRAEDCDDTDGANSPLLTETCGDQADNDCDGLDDEGCSPFVGGFVPLANADVKLTGETAYAVAGRSVDTAGDLDGDGFSDIVVGSADDAVAFNAGAAYVYYGSSAGIPGGSLAGADAKLTGEETEDEAGNDVASAGDVNGDGFDDLLIGARGAGSGDEGAAYVVLGGAARLTSASLSTAATKLTGEVTWDRAGYSVAGTGDLDDDGFDDIVVGATHHAATGTDAGTAYVLYGSASGIPSGPLAGADAELTGEVAFDEAGWSVAGTDTNADGFGDLLVGAPLNSSGARQAGTVYLFLGSSTRLSSGSLTQADALLVGANATDQAGWAVDRAGDVNGDGYPDVLIGANECSNLNPLMTNPGCAWVVHGSAAGIASMNLDTADTYLRGEVDYDLAGWSVSDAGDVDGDGFDDVLVGAVRAVSSSGRTYLVLGSASGVPTISLDLADAIFEGENTGDEAGEALGSAGDIDGDGRADLLIGSRVEDSAGAYAGAVYLILGSSL